MSKARGTNVQIRVADVAASRGLTFKDLRTRTGLKRKELRHWWDGTLEDINLEHLDRICLALEVHASEILDDGAPTYPLHEVAEILNVPVEVIEQEITLGVLAAQRVSGHWNVRDSDLEAYIFSHTFRGPNRLSNTEVADLQAALDALEHQDVATAQQRIAAVLKAAAPLPVTPAHQ